MKSISVALVALAIASASRAAPSAHAEQKRNLPVVGDLLVGTGLVTAGVVNPLIPEPVASVVSPGNVVGSVVNTVNGGAKRDLIDLSGIIAPGSSTNGLQQLGESLLNGNGALSPGQNTGKDGTLGTGPIPITGGDPIIQPAVVKRQILDLSNAASPGTNANPLSEGLQSLLDGSGLLSPGEGQATAAKRQLLDLVGALAPGSNTAPLGGPVEALLDGTGLGSPGQNTAPAGALPVVTPLKRQLLDLVGAAAPGSNTAPLGGPVQALLDGTGLLSPGQNTIPAGGLLNALKVKRQLLDLVGSLAPGSNTAPLGGAVQSLLDGTGLLSPGQNAADPSVPSVVVPATQIQKKRDSLPIPVVGPILNSVTGQGAGAEVLAALDGVLPLDSLLGSGASSAGSSPLSAPLSLAGAAKRQVQGIVDVTTAPLIGENGGVTAVTHLPLQAPIDQVVQALPVPGLHRKRSQASKRFGGPLGDFGSALDIHGLGSPGVDVAAGQSSPALINAENILSPGGGANTKGPLDGISDIPLVGQVVDLKGSLAAGN